jgi:hypothetical protein
VHGNSHPSHDFDLPTQPPKPKCPLHTPLPTARGGRHFTQGYFLAYRGFGDEGKEKGWLDKEIDHIGNGFPIN